MTNTVTDSRDGAERQRMHALYRAGGMARQMAPHVVYSHAICPWSGCDCRMQAIDFRLEDHGKGIHDQLVKAWWDDTGFAGRCPKCGRWIHFTIQEKRPIGDAAAAQLPQLPANWYAKATVL
jgi:hypothetical protein